MLDEQVPCPFRLGEVDDDQSAQYRIVPGGPYGRVLVELDAGWGWPYMLDEIRGTDDIDRVGAGDREVWEWVVDDHGRVSRSITVESALRTFYVVFPNYRS